MASCWATIGAQGPLYGEALSVMSATGGGPLRLVCSTECSNALGLTVIYDGVVHAHLSTMTMLLSMRYADYMLITSHIGKQDGVRPTFAVANNVLFVLMSNAVFHSLLPMIITNRSFTLRNGRCRRVRVIICDLTQASTSRYYYGASPLRRSNRGLIKQIFAGDCTRKYNTCVLLCAYVMLTR